MVISRRPVISRRRHGLLTAAACGLAVSLVACGSSGSAGPASGSPEPTIAMMPSANPFTSALVFTNGLGTAELAIKATTQVGDRTEERSGTVIAGMSPRGYGIGTWSADGTTVDELVNEKAVFDRPAGSIGRWTQQPEGERTPTSRMISPLAGLGDLEGVVAEGPDEVGTTPTTRWTGQLPADPDHLRRLGLTESDIDVIGDAWEGASIDVVVWIDDRNRIARVDRTLDLTGETGVPVRATVSTVLSDFTAPLDLTSPPTQSVTKLPGSASPSSS